MCPDDQALLRHGLQMMADAQPDLQVVGQAADGTEAVELAARLSPDVVLRRGSRRDCHIPGHISGYPA